MATDMTRFSACMKLFSSVDPKVYEQAIRLLDAHVTELMIAVSEAPPDQILVAQGRAQEARKMFQFMTELPSDTSQQPGNRPAP